MEKLYRKLENGRYEAVGYDVQEKLSDGIWLVQTKPYSRSLTSLCWKIGDLKRPVDVVTHASLLQLEDTLTRHISALREESSEEYNSFKERNGGFCSGPLEVLNFSVADLAAEVLRKIALTLEEG